MLNSLFKTTSILALGLLFLVSCGDSPKTTETADTTDTEETYTDVLTSETPCNCESSWFPHTQTPAPAEGKGSPFDVSSTTNCIFHQWSWQKFLWLTKPVGNIPLFLNQDSIFQTDDLMAKVPMQNGATVVLEYTNQAGPDNAVLTNNPAYNPAVNQPFPVFYSLHTSSIMFQQSHALKAALDAHTLDPDNLETFDVGSLELKVSWMITDAIPSDKLANYYTTTAAVKMENEDHYQLLQVAMMGMHVVGVVENHPEFIWATFEHNDIAPNYDWTTNSASSASEKLLFSTGNTTGLGGITYDTTANAAVIPNKAYDLFQYGVPVNSSGYMSTSQSEPANFNNIQNINNCVAGNLTDVFRNYFYNGSIWLNTDGMTPTEQAQKIVDLGYGIGVSTPGSFTRGSVNNANVSMETFTQTFQTDISKVAVNNLTNCFSCHSAISFQNNKSPIYLSHVFDAFVQAGQGKTRDQINTMKDKQQILQLIGNIK